MQQAQQAQAAQAMAAQQQQQNLVAQMQAAMMGQMQAMAAQQQAMMAQGQAIIAQMMAQNQVGPPNWVDTGLDYATDFFAGYANIVTAGYYNQWIGGNAAFVNTNSWSYTIGQGAGWAWWAAMGTTLAWNIAGGPTYNVGIQFGGNPPYGFHTVFGVTSNGTTTWAGAVGSELGAMGVYGAPSGEQRGQGNKGVRTIKINSSDPFLPLKPFTTFAAAQQYYMNMANAGKNPGFFVYQSTAAMAPNGPIPPLSAGPGTFNFATLMYSPVANTLFWQYMNNGNSSGNQTVYHKPVKPPSPTLGLPATSPQGFPYLTNVYCVYVPPPPPPPPPPVPTFYGNSVDWFGWPGY